MSRKTLRSAIVVAGAVLCAAVFLAGPCLACPNCKDALAGGSAEGMNVARGYALSILIMLGMPFTLAGTFALYVWREMRRLKRDGAAADPSASVRPLP